MNKNYALIVITFLCSFYFCFGQSVIISQYIETSSGSVPKGIEIFNVSGSDINFSAVNNLEVFQGTNGGACSSIGVDIQSGTLAANEVWVIGTSDLTAYATANAVDLSGTTTHTFVFNGDDALQLMLGGSVQDMFGTCGSDPGNSWNSGGVETRNNNLQIKNGICSGDTDGWTDPSVRFDEIAVGTDMIGFGTAPASCSTTDTFVGFTSATSTLVENGVTIDVCVNITNPSPTVATTVDVSLDVSSSATNGIDFDDGAGSPMAITFPQTLTFPANSSTNQCISFFISNDDLIYEGDETIVLNLSNPTGGINAGLNLNTQHILTILDDETPVIADVVITEIMYNSLGVDDEWIEICNTTGISQVLNDYIIEVDGNPEFTFPSTGYTIAPGQCITVSLGDGGGLYNPGCNFTPTETTGPGTDNLSNTSGTIEIIASDGITSVDIVNYNDGGGGNPGDGGGASLHVTDDSLDNSDTNTNWQFVIDGGSPGFNTLISQCSPMEPEINVEGDINTFPNISDNDFTPSFFDNTRFSNNIDIVSGSETKSFRIQNIGTATLSIFNIQIVGANPGDFSVTSPAVLVFNVGDISTMSNVETFDVTFNPTAVGVRNAIVRIINNDSADGEGEEIFEFAIQGEGVCTTASNAVTPLSGPGNTVVTISGSDLNGSTAVQYAGAPIAHTVISPTEIEITIPVGSTSGNIVVTNNIGCQTSDPFTVIDNMISSCEGTSGLTPTDLFISEVTDAPTGSHTYIEIFNGTGAPVNLADYEIRIHNNGSNNAGGDIADLDATVTMPHNSTYVIGIGGADATDPEGGFTADDFFPISGINNNDNIRLYTDDGTTETWIDVWGDITGATFTAAASGYTYRRKNTGIVVPRTDGWNGPLGTDDMINDWDVLTPVNYLEIGDFDFSTGIPPVITDQPDPMPSSCDLSASFSLTANQGFAGGLPLAYQWFVSVPGIDGWTALTNTAPYSGVNTATLNISNTLGLFNYQYYCQVRENTNTCYTASDAVRVITHSTTWTGTWSNGTPTLSSVVFINQNYDTSTSSIGSFSACSVTINSGTLSIRNGDYVEINYDLIVNGTLDIETEGSLIMIDDTGTVTNNGATNVHKTTTEMETYDYTYWSSPVDYSISGTSAQTVLTGFRPSRIYRFTTSQFFDVLDANGNAGADGFDDDLDAWTNHYSHMTSGVGFAAMTNGSGGHFRNVIFSGRLNTGNITVAVALSQNAADTNDDWNLLGNPYPSSIFVDDFIAHNSNLSGTVYLWTHEDDISISNPGPDAYNFNSNDYAMYNSVGGVGTASTGTVVSNVPTGYIASGQGFFVEAITAGNVEFTNAMRNRTYNNNDFFRNSEVNSSTISEKDRMWLNLTNADGAFSQILIGYIEDATLGKDRLYDGIRLNGSNYIDFYSKDQTNLYKYGIQGRPTFTINDVIPIGYNSNILGELTISLYQTEGVLNDISVYLKDNLLNVIHDLTNSDYSFTTENGNFENRFEIVFQTEEALSIDDNEINSDQISIIELQNGSVKFSVGNNLTITSIEIIDLLGRTLYNLKANNATEIFELHNLSQTAYIAKVSLSNGQTIIKRAVKRN